MVCWARQPKYPVSESKVANTVTPASGRHRPFSSASKPRQSRYHAQGRRVGGPHEVSANSKHTFHAGSPSPTGAETAPVDESTMESIPVPSTIRTFPRGYPKVVPVSSL